MSLIGKKPYASKVLESCTKAQLKTFLNLMNSLDSETPMFISLNPLSSHPITSADKGVRFVSFRLNDLLALTVTGILVYTDTECGLFGQVDGFPSVLEYKIDPIKKTYDQVQENLTAEELRRAATDGIVNIEVESVEAGDINSGSEPAGKVLVSNGEGGAEWGEASGNGPKIYYVDDLGSDYIGETIEATTIGDILVCDNEGYICIQADESVRAFSKASNTRVTSVAYLKDSPEDGWYWDDTYITRLSLYKHTLTWDYGYGDTAVLSWISTKSANVDTSSTWSNFKQNYLDKAVKLCEFFDSTGEGEALMLIGCESVVINNTEYIAFCGATVGGDSSSLVWQFGSGANWRVTNHTLNESVTPTETIEILDLQ